MAPGPVWFCIKSFAPRRLHSRCFRACSAISGARDSQRSRPNAGDVSVNNRCGVQDNVAASIEICNSRVQIFFHNII